MVTLQRPAAARHRTASATWSTGPPCPAAALAAPFGGCARNGRGQRPNTLIFWTKTGKQNRKPPRHTSKRILRAVERFKPSGWYAGINHPLKSAPWPDSVAFCPVFTDQRLLGMGEAHVSKAKRYPLLRCLNAQKPIPKGRPLPVGVVPALALA
jgi:hypothetical protein